MRFSLALVSFFAAYVLAQPTPADKDLDWEGTTYEVPGVIGYFAHFVNEKTEEDHRPILEIVNAIAGHKSNFLCIDHANRKLVSCADLNEKRDTAKDDDEDDDKDSGADSEIGIEHWKAMTATYEGQKLHWMGADGKECSGKVKKGDLKVKQHKKRMGACSVGAMKSHELPEEVHEMLWERFKMWQV